MPRIEIPQSQVMPDQVSTQRVSSELFTGGGQQISDMAKQLEQINQQFKKVRDFRETTETQLKINEEISSINQAVANEKDPNKIADYTSRLDALVNKYTPAITDNLEREQFTANLQNTILDNKLKISNEFKAKELDQANGNFIIAFSEINEKAIKSDKSEWIRYEAQLEGLLNNAKDKGIKSETEVAQIKSTYKQVWEDGKKEYENDLLALQKKQEQDYKNYIGVYQSSNAINIYNKISNAKTIEEKQKLLDEINIAQGLETFKPEQSINEKFASNLKKLIILPKDKESNPKDKYINLTKLTNELDTLLDKNPTIEDIGNFMNKVSELKAEGKVGEVDKLFKLSLEAQNSIAENKALDKLKAQRVGVVGFLQKITPFVDFIKEEDVDALKGQILEEYYNNTNNMESKDAYEKALIDVVGQTNEFYNVFKKKKVGEEVVLPDGTKVIYNGIIDGEIEFTIK